MPQSLTMALFDSEVQCAAEILRTSDADGRLRPMCFPKVDLILPEPLIFLNQRYESNTMLSRIEDTSGLYLRKINGAKSTQFQLCQGSSSNIQVDFLTDSCLFSRQELCLIVLFHVLKPE
jgi:hypothetical protein